MPEYALPTAAAETNQGPGPADDYDPLDKEDVLVRFNSHFKTSRDHFQAWRYEARALYDMIAGRQWDPTDETQLRDENRPVVTFNIAGKYMDAVTGLQINNRQDIRYYPREPGDAAVNELLTGAVAFGRDLCDQADEETDAFYDATLTGMGWMEGYFDRDLEPTGVPAGVRVDPLEMFPDPNARKRNLQDMRYCIRVKFVDKDEYDELTGDDEEYQDNRDLAELSAEEDDVLSIIEEPQDYLSPGSADTRRRSRKPVAHYQFWRREPATLVMAEGFGQTVMSAKEWQFYEPLLQRARRPYKATPLRRKRYYRAVIVGGRVKSVELSPWQEGFTWHAITGKRDRNEATWYGIGRSILDPQKWVNKFFSTILYALMTNAKGGLMAEENTFKDPRKAEADWANPSSIVWLKEGAISKGKVQTKPDAKYPEGLDRLLEFSMAMLPQTSGLNLELLGLADRVQAGVVEAQRKQSAMSIIAWAFDGMRRYYRSMGRQQASYVRDYMPEGTLILINGEQGQQYIPLIKSRISMLYDVIVDEAPTSVNMKERVWLVLQSLIPQLLQAGMAIPKEVLDYSPLPADLAQKWKQALEPDPQKQKIDEQMLRSTLDKLISEALENKATAALNIAKSEEIRHNIANPAEDPQSEAMLERWKAQVDAQSRIAMTQLKAEADAEAKILAARIKAESDERIANMECAIDARMESARIASDSTNQERESKRETEREAKDTKRREKHEKMLADALNGVTEVVRELKRPKKHRMKRDKAGDLLEIVTE